MIDLDRIDARREVRKPNYGLTQVCIAEDDFDAMVRELRTLRARVAELEEERLVKDEAEPKSAEEPTEWAWYYDGSSVQGDGFATREEAIRDAVIGHEAERFLVGPMRDLDLAEWVDAADIAERISESIWDNLGLEDIRVYAGPAAQAALEAWARNNLSPDPSRYCEGEPVKPNGLGEAFGAWPGDESDEEIEAALQERTPEEETLHDALRRYGFKEQLAMLQEECGELVAAVSRWRRGREGAFHALLEEIADVEILIDQMRLEFGAEIDAARARKLARLRERLG